jgi:hypothetical protein
MSLYGRTDSSDNITQAGLARGNGAGSATETIVFVDETEASLSENKERGINGPGWWAYRTYTDGAGKTRHKAEMLAFISNADTTETAADDTIAADVASAITISAQPADVTGAADPFTGTFAVTATADVGTVNFQWQRQTPSGTRWSNVSDAGVFSGATTATLTLTAAAKADWDGYKFRVKLTSTAGAEEVISDSASITYA